MGATPNESVSRPSVEIIENELQVLATSFVWRARVSATRGRHPVMHGSLAQGQALGRLTGSIEVNIRYITSDVTTRPIDQRMPTQRHESSHQDLAGNPNAAWSRSASAKIA